MASSKQQDNFVGFLSKIAHIVTIITTSKQLRDTFYYTLPIDLSVIQIMCMINGITLTQNLFDLNLYLGKNNINFTGYSTLL